MKRLLFGITLLFFAVVSCSKSKPKGILSEQKMADLMTEVYAVDGYLNVMPIDSSRKLLPVFYQHIFDEYGIDSAQFVQNTDFYYGDPVLLEKLLKEVSVSLTKYERQAVQKDSVHQAHVRDSISVVQRWTRLAQEAEMRVRNVHIDTTYSYGFTQYSHDFFAGLPLMTEQSRLHQPMPTRPTDAAPKEVSPVEELPKAEVPQDTRQIEVDPVDRPLNLQRLEHAPQPQVRRPVPVEEAQEE